MINQRSCKRQKPNGSIVTNLAGHGQQSHFPQRGFTYPPIGCNFQLYPGSPTSISLNSISPRPWPQGRWPPSPLSRHPSQQWNSQGLPTPTTASCSQLTSPISPASSGPQQDALPPHSTCQQSPFQTPLAKEGSSDRVSQGARQGGLVQERSYFPSRDDARNQYPLPGASNYDARQEETEESWWQELQALDYADGPYGSKHVGEFLKHVRFSTC